MVTFENVSDALSFILDHADDDDELSVNDSIYFGFSEVYCFTSLTSGDAGVKAGSAAFTDLKDERGIRAVLSKVFERDSTLRCNDDRLEDE